MLGAIIAVEGTAAISAARIEHLTRMLDHLTDEDALLLGGVEPGGAAQPVKIPRGMSELGAVAAVLAQAGQDHAMVLAADLKQPSLELLRYMAMVRAGHDAVVPEGPDGTVQPMLAIYHGRLTGRAQGLANSGERDVRALLEDAQVRRVSLDEVAKFGSPATLLARGSI
jgi:molybdopterin-guanine dinucleotide biosynthesis protein A